MNTKRNPFAELAEFVNNPSLEKIEEIDLSEIEETIRMLESEGCDEVILLHCVSCYPPRPEDTNLRNITTFQKAFELPVGYSDHSPENISAIAAVALGAMVIEKHITLDIKIIKKDAQFISHPDQG